MLSSMAHGRPCRLGRARHGTVGKGRELGVKFLRLQSHDETGLRHVIAELLRVCPGRDAVFDPSEE